MDEAFVGCHANGACVVVGGGPSVSVEVLGRLEDTPLVGTNASLFAEGLDAVRDRFVAGIILDEALFLAQARRIVRACDFPVFLGNSRHDNDGFVSALRALGIHRIPSNHTEGFGDSFARFGNGGNSGFAAIQLAYLLGFRRVGLLGFDGAPDGAVTHFHTEYGDVADSERAEFFDRCCGELESYADVFRAIGLCVSNLSPQSRLKGYETLGVDEWLARRADPVAPGAMVAVEDLPYVPGEPPGPEGYYRNMQVCYGGAVNVAMEDRFRPVPDLVMASAGERSSVARGAAPDTGLLTDEVLGARRALIDRWKSVRAEGWARLVDVVAGWGGFDPAEVDALEASELDAQGWRGLGLESGQNGDGRTCWLFLAEAVAETETMDALVQMCGASAPEVLLVVALEDARIARNPEWWLGKVAEVFWIEEYTTVDAALCISCRR